ncbi:XRE family transcriptional regulator [Nocardia sp. NPDC127526]|uniref:XRE family transcriptional regulator n=1 Tax=Nocardia sp. NPDC127526 TaxID=3345393 RepID=UPI003631DD3F
MILDKADGTRTMIRAYLDLQRGDSLAGLRVAAALAIVDQAAALRLTRAELAAVLGLNGTTNLSHLMMGRLNKYSVEWLLRAAQKVGARLEYSFSPDPNRTETLRQWRVAQLDR